jgi:hypothetical protein
MTDAKSARNTRTEWTDEAVQELRDLVVSNTPGGVDEHQARTQPGCDPVQRPL